MYMVVPHGYSVFKKQCFLTEHKKKTFLWCFDNFTNYMLFFGIKNTKLMDATSKDNKT